MDVVDLILNDHRELERLFDTLQRDPATRLTLVPVMVSLLTAHSRAEEAEVYPAAVEAGATKDVEHSQKEHLEADQLAKEVSEADVESPDFEEKLDKLIHAVKHHVGEEESTVLPEMRAGLDADRLDELARRFLASREEHLGDMPRDITKDELEQQAANAQIPGGSSKTKDELAEELASAAEE
jgi:hemerythrin superfamily protein